MININKDVYKKIFKLIKKYDEIVLARHIGPDPDAVASQIALRDSIKLTFPNKRVYAVGAGVSKFKYLGSLDKPDFNSLTNSLLIVLEVPNFYRIDGADDLDYKDIVKIDHHPKEDIIGTADFTSSDYSSTCEMVAKLCKDYNLDFTNLYANLYQKSFNECKFEAYIINNLIITDNKFGYILIDNKVVEEYKVDLSTASVLINNFNFIEELNVWCFITYDERNEIYKVNIRSRGPIINEVASKYNGGGHQYASGVRISEKKDVDALIKDLDEVASNYLAEEQN